MKFSLAILIAVLLCSCSNQYHDVENSASDYNIIPKPVGLEMTTGKFLLDRGTSIGAPSSLANEGMFLAKSLGQLVKHEVLFSENGSSTDITLQLDNTIENEEGYALDVGYDAIKISGKNATGVFYGIQSLLQLINLPNQDAKNSDVTIPAVRIEDHPRFGYRGMHLDVARHFFDIDFVKKYIDLIALHKMNTFHWHLTEDQGWRIEIKKYPKLTEIGAWRNGTIIGHKPGTGNDEKNYGGFYTQEDVKEVVAYATERHVTVIPEIELPGHSSAAIAAYPYLSCFPEEPTLAPDNMGSKKGKEIQAAGTPKIVQETWGVFDDVYCAGKENTFTFLQDVLDEVIPLFPAKYIHIGGDECPKSNWKRCPDCQSRIKKEGLHDEHELQSYFITRIEKYLNSKGKSIIGWDEILEGGLAPNATVMSWRGIKGDVEAAKHHHDVIITPHHTCYFDKYQVKGAEAKAKEPLSIGGNITVSDVYAFEPIPTELTQEESKYVLGAQGNVWTEYIKTTDYAEYMVLPRMTALSEVVWTQKGHKDWENFKVRLERMRDLYDAYDLNYAKHVLEKQ